MQNSQKKQRFFVTERGASMTRVQINAFLTVAREKSFTRAANVLYISQPAISKSISTMEEELGFRLFDRKENVLALTSAGEQMYDFFVRVIEEFNELQESITNSLSSDSSCLRIGCPDTWNPRFFYDRIRSHFSLQRPSVRLSVECGKLSDLIISLKSGKLDIVLAHDFYSPTIYGIESELLVTTGCGLIYSREHFGDVSDISEFRNTSFLLYDSDIQKRLESVIRDICRDRFTPAIRTDGQIANALFSVACGEGVMLFSDWDSVVSNKAYGFLPLEERMQVRLIYSAENRAPLVDEMIKEIPPLFA